MSKDLSKFDHGNLISLRVFLNGESFPLENLNLAIDKNRYIPLYMMYCAFQECYWVILRNWRKTMYYIFCHENKNISNHLLFGCE